MAGASVTQGAGGTGYVVARDIVGTASAPTTGDGLQYVKHDHGAAGLSSPSTVLNPFPVGQIIQLIQVVPTVDAGNVYASGDLINDVATITGAALGTGGLCELVSVTISDASDNTASAYTIFVTNLSTTWGTFNAAPTLVDAGALGIQAIIPIATGDWIDLGGFKVAQPRIAQNVGCICKTSGSANLYTTVLNGAGTPTFAASALTLTFGFRQVAVS
jgi:hypothetical protein